jgi:hypothetical protein
LLGVKCGLLCLHPLDQFFDPLKHKPIRDAGRHVTVMLDFTVEFDALFTHGTRLKVTGGEKLATCYLMTAAGLFCFNDALESFYCPATGTYLFLRHHSPVFDLVRNGLTIRLLCGIQAGN